MSTDTRTLVWSYNGDIARSHPTGWYQTLYFPRRHVWRLAHRSAAYMPWRLIGWYPSRDFARRAAQSDYNTKF